MGDNERLGDVQEMSAAEISVYEAVASMDVDGRTATVREVAAMVQLPEETVRNGLEALTRGGRLVRRGEAYVLGPHDWGLEY
jgi:DNA-binding IclR family transcriptional regulator